MNPLVTQIVGAVIRAVLQAVGGNMVAQGYLDADELNKGIGALICIGSLGWSIFHKYRTHTAPGGDFNPNAVVKRAEPVTPSLARGPLGRGGGNQKGFALVDVLFAQVLFAICVMAVVMLAIAAPRASEPSKLADRDLPANVDYSSWIKFTLVEDPRPFVPRFLDSISVKFTPRLSQDEDKQWHVGIAKFEVSGGAAF
ncbi:hypothetical protein BH09VER1_BH09VER1_28550 [soil metagenome]